jgi:hypothetical protein
VIVLVIDIDSVTFDKAKGDSPIPAYANRPGAFTVASEWVQKEPRQAHVFRINGNLKPTQYQFEAVRMLRLNTRLDAFDEKSLKALVPKGTNHGLIVTCNVSGVKYILGTAPVFS